MTEEEAIEFLTKISYALGTMAVEYLSEKDGEKMREAIKALEQEPKIGHWITENMSDGDVGYRCSECNELFWLECGTPKDNKYNFCPKCGERLIEPHESEV